MNYNENDAEILMSLQYRLSSGANITDVRVTLILYRLHQAALLASAPPRIEKTMH